VCFGEAAGKANANYAAWCLIRKTPDNKLALTLQLYIVDENDLVHTKEYEEYAKNTDELINIIKKEVPLALKEKIPGVVRKSKLSSAAPVEGVTGGVQATGEEYIFSKGKRFAIELSTDPPGARPSFDGIASDKCEKTNCKLTLEEGNVRIVANLDQYEIADTTIFVKQNNQAVHIVLKPNFGIFQVKPAYIDGIGQKDPWSLRIDGAAYNSYENRLSPGSYSANISHNCYEPLSYTAIIEKGKRDVFDLSGQIILRKGGLILNAERNGVVATEPVFVNDVNVGETPYTGAVPLCASIRIGEKKEKVKDLKLAYKKDVEWTHQMQIEKPLNKSLIAAIALDILGAAMIGYAVYENGETKSAYDEYLVRGNEIPYYEDKWKAAESHRDKRNMFYVIGGAVLASGIGVHIWF